MRTGESLPVEKRERVQNSLPESCNVVALEGRARQRIFPEKAMDTVQSVSTDVHWSTLPPRELDVATLSLGPISLNFRLFLAYAGERLLELTRLEFDILAHLMRNESRVVSQQELVREVTGGVYSASSSVIRVHISRLRTKLGEHANVIRTIRSRGFRFAAPPPNANASTT